LNLIYKLVEVERAGEVHEAAKLSAAKVTYPGRKQVLRYSNSKGQYIGDKIILEGEPSNGSEPMLNEVMRGGRRSTPAESISVLKGRCINSLARLPQSFLRINRSAVYPVRYSQRLKTMLERVRRRVRRSTLK